MNFLIQSTTLNYKINHKVAVHLSELYPGSKFGVIISSHGNKKKYLEEQKDLKYEFVHDVSNIESEFLKQGFSNKELKEFEKTIPEKSLWRFIAMDRYWGKAFCKGASKYFDNREKVAGQVKQEDILKVTCGYIRYFNKILNELKADVVLFFPGFHSLINPVLEQCCKNLDILHIALVGSRVKNYYTITPDTHCTFPHIESTYKKIIINEIDVDLSPGEKCYEELNDSVGGGADYSYHSKLVKKIFSDFSEKKEKKPGYIYLLSKSLASTALQWLRSRKLQREKGGGVGHYNLKYFVYQSIHDLLLSYQSKRLLCHDFYDRYNPGIKYLYFPLTAQPEYATQVMDNMWINQLTIVEALAKSIPFDWKIYVKEHPGTIGWRVRPFSFYREIREYPNVRLIPIDLENNEVVRNSQMIVTISSTAAWENILFHGKPIINFSRCIYNITGLAKQCSDLTELSMLIHDEYIRINAIETEERKRRVVALLNAILLNSFWIENPLPTFTAGIVSKKYANEGYSSNDEFNINAKNIALAIKKYISEF